MDGYTDNEEIIKNMCQYVALDIICWRSETDAWYITSCKYANLPIQGP